ncbi:MAG TPA: hypothetical protein PLP42_22760, partial [Acidobacteriota bacterium]|nr:hypothetical protein [Acidobacteriota bacterium]
GEVWPFYATEPGDFASTRLPGDWFVLPDQAKEANKPYRPPSSPPKTVNLPAERSGCEKSGLAG